MTRPGSAFRGIAAAIGWALASVAVAGDPGGPYVVWVNLGGAASRHVDRDVREAVNADAAASTPLCWDPGALLYMRERPPGITNALVRRALVARDDAARRRLAALLRKPYGEVPAFDGIVAYVDDREPRLVSLTVEGRLRSDTVRTPTGEAAWLPAFCNVVPPIDHPP